MTPKRGFQGWAHTIIQQIFGIILSTTTMALTAAPLTLKYANSVFKQPAAPVSFAVAHFAFVALVFFAIDFRKHLNLWSGHLLLL